MTMRDVKICLLGDSGVGKSSLVMRFVLDQFKPHLESTIGSSFMTKNLLVDENTYKFQIWDTAGQEKYRALAPMYYRGAAAAIVVYDVTKESSFQMVKDWIRELRKHGPVNIVLAITGNKSDLEDLREVRTKDGMDYADNVGAIFAETSALNAANVGALFTSIAKKLPMEPDNSYGHHPNVNVTRDSQPTQRRSTCCGSRPQTRDDSEPFR